MGFLLLRVCQLQIVDFKKYKTLAHNNTTRRSLARAPRGIIYDRDGKILASSKQSLSIVLYPAVLKQQKDLKKFAKKLSFYVDLDRHELLDLLKNIDPSTPLPIALDHDIDIKTAIKIHENASDLPGVFVQEEAIRYYPFANIAAHLLGYVGQVNSNELKKSQNRALGLGDIIGKDGVENSFDEQLQGTKGESSIAVDRYGKVLENKNFDDLEFRKPIKGKDLHLTIDYDLQKIAQDALGSNMGAVVVVKAKTGEILTLASAPSFDPNIFTKPVKNSVYQDLLNKKAFLNRALNAYTPGSVWKPITALTALDHQVLKTTDYYKVSGSVSLNGFQFGDWTSKEDTMNLYDALAWSRNTFFYNVAKNLDPDWITDLGKSFGAGKKTNIEIPGESSGLLPSAQWKKKVYKEPWYPGNTLHFSIGQSFLLLTPLQVARIYSAIANDGYLPQLHLVKQDEYKLEKIDDFQLKNLEIVKKALEKCVDQGTGQAAKLPDVKIAGKTGSAEVFGYKKSTHGWFASWAPVKDPEIVVVVFMEGGGHGGTVAAPIAKMLYRAYFDKIKANETKSITINS
jgi:penicillin-binding protein 2